MAPLGNAWQEDLPEAAHDTHFVSKPIKAKARIFTFVSSQDKCASRKLARSHVAREIWQQKRRENEVANTREVPGALVWRLKKKRHDLAKTTSKTPVEKFGRLCPMAVVPGTTGVNPFPNYKLEYGAGTEELLHHCM